MRNRLLDTENESEAAIRIGAKAAFRNLVALTVREVCSDSCPAFEVCTSRTPDRDCPIVVSYLDNVFRMVRNRFVSGSKEDISRVGLHLIPLYKTLIKLKILESVVGSPIVCGKEKVSIHPVYKEIRETIRAIEQVWRMISSDSGRKSGTSVPRRGASGTTSLYEQMLEQDRDIKTFDPDNVRDVPARNYYETGGHANRPSSRPGPYS
jgi:hypothetical protein